jgi:hypothetical protein
VEIKTVKPVTDEEIFYDKFSYDKFYLLVANLATLICQFLPCNAPINVNPEGGGVGQGVEI